MKPLQILMPMGGLGQRFRDAGINIPKPLIPVNGIPMFQLALAAFNPYPGPKEYCFIVRLDAELEFRLATHIKKLFPKGKVVLLTQNTRGVVETCLRAEKIINPKKPLVIMDCDITFDAPDYFTMLQSDIWDGVLLSFTSNDARYSYARTDISGCVTETAEKIPISTNALAGSYFFARASIFFDAAHELLKQPLDEQMKEYYISFVYRLLISHGKKIGLARGKFTSFGTPEELSAFLSTHKCSSKDLIDYD